jgi:hypothetical protein
MATTRFRDPATGRFISAEAAARLSVPTASVTKPGPATKKDKKRHGKKQADKKQLPNKKTGKKRTGPSKKKRKKKG